MQTQLNEFKKFISSQLDAYMTLPLFRNAHALMLNTVVTSGLGVVYWILAARYYDKSEVGLGSAAISTMMFLSGLAQLNMGSALIRFIPEAGGSVHRLLAYVYLISSILAAVIAAGFIATSNMWLQNDNFIGNSAPFAVWYIASVVAWGIFTLQDCAITGLRQAFWLPIENAGFGVAKIVLLIVFAALLPGYGVFASWTIPMALSLIPINILIFWRLVPEKARTSTSDNSKITLSQLVPFVTGEYIGSLFFLTSTSLLPIMVISQLGSGQNAYFYIAWVIGSSLDLFSTNMATSLTAEGAADQGALVEYSRHSLAHMARIQVPAALVLLIGSSLILSVFGADYAENASTLLRLLGLSLLPKAINTLYLGIARVRRQMRLIVLIQGGLCALTLGLSVVLIKDFGITGIGIAWLAAQTVVAVILAVTQSEPGLFRRTA